MAYQGLHHSSTAARCLISMHINFEGREIVPIKFTAGEAGFLPFPPCTVFVGMVKNVYPTKSSKASAL